MSGGPDRDLRASRDRGGEEFHRVLEVGKQHSHLFAFAFKRALGVRIFSARCFGVYVSGGVKRRVGRVSEPVGWAHRTELGRCESSRPQFAHVSKGGAHSSQYSRRSRSRAGTADIHVGPPCSFPVPGALRTLRGGTVRQLAYSEWTDVGNRMYSDHYARALGYVDDGGIGRCPGQCGFSGGTARIGYAALGENQVASLISLVRVRRQQPTDTVAWMRRNPFSLPETQQWPSEIPSADHATADAPRHTTHRTVGFSRMLVLDIQRSTPA